jgi:hypothetical protein
MAAIDLHNSLAQGIYQFAIQSATWAGSPDRTRPGCAWRYAADLDIDDRGNGTHDVVVVLEMERIRS